MRNTVRGRLTAKLGVRLPERSRRRHRRDAERESGGEDGAALLPKLREFRSRPGRSPAEAHRMKWSRRRRSRDGHRLPPCRGRRDLRALHHALAAGDRRFKRSSRSWRCGRSSAGCLLTHFDQLFLALVLVDVIVALTARGSDLRSGPGSRPERGNNGPRTGENIRSGRGRLQAARRVPCSCISRAAAPHCRAGDCPAGVARLSAEVLAPLPTTTAPAAALTIIDQMPTSLRSVFKPLRLRQAERRRCGSSDPLVPV